MSNNNPITLSASTAIVLVRLDDKAFEKSVNLFTSQATRELTENYYNYIFTAACNYLESGDVNIINTLYLASQMVGKVRLTQQCADLFACHKRLKKGTYGKQMDKNKRKELLADLDALNTKLVSIIAASETLKAAKPAKEWDELAKLRQLVKLVAELEEHGVDQKLIQSACGVEVVESEAVLKIAA